MLWFWEVGRLHKGHRERLKKKFIKCGADSLETHELLELLLYYGIPRKDTNELAHTLINIFGSLPQVFDAPMSSLLKVDGVGESTAILIRLVSKLSRVYAEKNYEANSKRPTKTQVEQIILNKFIGRIKEHVVLVLFDAKRNMVFCDVVSQGSFGSTGFHIREIIELALKFNAMWAIIAHNHPSGIALPSREDVETTIELRNALRLIEVKLVDHIIVADNDYVSIADSELGKQIL